MPYPQTDVYKKVYGIIVKGQRARTGACMAKQNNREIGSRFEQTAADYLEEKGYRILARNFRCRFGELDIVAAAEQTIVFVEVKYRRKCGSGYPEESVTAKKQRTICRCALFFLQKMHFEEGTSVRFDVIALDKKEIRHHKNAFPFTETAGSTGQVL